MHKLFDFVMTTGLVAGIMSFGVLVMSAGLSLFFAVAAPGFWLDVFSAAAIASLGLFMSCFGLVFILVIFARLAWAKIDPFI